MNFRKYKTGFLFGLLAVIIAAPAYALTQQDQQDIRRVEEYLNAMPPVKADFTQIAPSGKVYTGKFYLKRPGRLRFQYDGEARNFVVADGFFIHFWDDKNKNQSSAPISQTLADFLLREQIVLSGDVTVTHIKRNAGLLTVRLVETSNPDAGALTMIFNERPLNLRQWRVTDPSGDTEVTLLNPQYNADIDPGLFLFEVP